MENHIKKNRHLLVGITGGIASGKSQLGAIIKKMGYPVLSADIFAKEITLPGNKALQEISSVFGSNAIQADGQLDRKFVREEIIRDPSLREKLNAITHPRIQEKTLSAVKELFKKGETIVFYEAPLLYEAKSDQSMDFVVCVAANDELRIQRTMQRDNVSEAAARKMLQSQMLQEEKIKRADFVILNNEDNEALEMAAKELVGKLTALT